MRFVVVALGAVPLSLGTTATIFVTVSALVPWPPHSCTSARGRRTAGLPSAAVHSLVHGRAVEGTRRSVVQRDGQEPAALLPDERRNRKGKIWPPTSGGSHAA